jgi:hypothetical protein
MESSVNIIKIVDGKYRLNIEVLRSVLSQAENCKIALISIIGPKFSGKTLLLNCLINYLESNDRNSWPKDSVIKAYHGFKNERNEKPVIQMWSKPFILEDEGQKIAVFLMDSSHVFTECTISESKIMEEIIGLFLLTSSTLIYNKTFFFTVKNFIAFLEKLILKKRISVKFFS